MSKLRLLYIAGPYRSSTINGIFNNIMEARKRMEWAWVNGWVPVCPHMNSAFCDGVVPDDIILEGYKEVVARCDAILLMHNWKSSSGAVAEYHRAKAAGVEIILDPIVPIQAAVDFGDYIAQINGPGKEEE